MKSMTEILSEIITGGEDEKTVTTGGGHYDPSNNAFYDVNEAFRGLLCDLTHGVDTIYHKQPFRHPDGIGSTVYETSALFLEDTRNGEVVRFGMPRLYTYTDPCSRVLQHKGRRANPFFHLYEAMWMLAGSDDVRKLTPFASNMANYSDDGYSLHGAYGHRWRNHFDGGDQLKDIIQALKDNPADRRLVLQMWDADNDLRNPSRDVPCNTHCYVQTRRHTDGTVDIDLTVMNRSNDIIWGMLGSNYVTFSFLLEYLAGMTGYKVGFYHHFSANAHVYTEKYNRDTFVNWHEQEPTTVVVPVEDRIPLVSAPACFDREVTSFVEDPYNTSRYTNDFFNAIAVPMMHAHKHYKDGDIFGAVRQAGLIVQEDWRVACINWLGSSKLAKKTTEAAPNN